MDKISQDHLETAVSEDTQATDHSLLRRFRKGNEHAATKLYFRYANRLQALVRSKCSSDLANRLEPEDIVQSVFGRFFSRVHDRDYDVPPGEELWGLLLVITLNKLRSEEAFHRAGKRDVRLTTNEAKSEIVLDHHGKDDDTALAMLEMTVQETLDVLPLHYHDIIELRIQGFDVAEVAQRTGRSKRTVERVLQNFRAKLQDLLSPES